MTHEQATHALNLNGARQDEVNPLRVALNHEFDSKDSGSDYRERAIDRVVAAKLEFSSETNTFYSLSKRYVKVVCPYCENIISGHGGGGNFLTETVDFPCKCGARVSLTMLSRGISIHPPEKKEP